MPTFTGKVLPALGCSLRISSMTSHEKNTSGSSATAAATTSAFGEIDLATVSTNVGYCGSC